MQQQPALSSLALAITLALTSQQLIAQETAPEPTAAEQTEAAEAAPSGLGFERILVTGAVSRNQTVMQSSVSVSTLTFEDIDASAPRSTAEVFRMLPGVRSEASGGEGNANIAVRGLPVAPNF